MPGRGFTEGTVNRLFWQFLNYRERNGEEECSQVCTRKQILLHLCISAVGNTAQTELHTSEQENVENVLESSCLQW